MSMTCFCWRSGGEVLLPSVGDQVGKFDIFLAEISSSTPASARPSVYEDLSIQALTRACSAMFPGAS